jgi:hypothetical protein
MVSFFLFPRKQNHAIHKCNGDHITNQRSKMDSLHIVPDPRYRGEGISEGLARGLLVFSGPENLTGEGMGLGSIAIRGDRCTFFSRSCTDSVDPESDINRTFSLDTRMSWSIGGIVSPLLTRVAEDAIGFYMRHPGLQALAMAPVMPLRRILAIRPVFETIPAVAEATFRYRVTGSRVRVQVRVRPLVPDPGTICILNELGGKHFTGCIESGATLPSPPGYEELPLRFPTPALFDPGRGIRFRLCSVDGAPQLPVRIFRGREQGGDLSWAGISIEIDHPGGREEISLEYQIDIARYEAGANPVARWRKTR